MIFKKVGNYLLLRRIFASFLLYLFRAIADSLTVKVYLIFLILSWTSYYDMLYLNSLLNPNIIDTY